MKNHHLTPKYDFHNYMIHSMEEEFQKIVGVSGPLWGFVITFMLFISKLVLLGGTKLQHVITTLTLKSTGISGFFSGIKLSLVMVSFGSRNRKFCYPCSISSCSRTLSS